MDLFSDNWTKVVHSEDALAPVLYIYPQNDSSVRVVPKRIQKLDELKSDSDDRDNSRVIPAACSVYFAPFHIVDNLIYYFIDILGCQLATFLDTLSRNRVRCRWILRNTEQCNLDILTVS